MSATGKNAFHALMAEVTKYVGDRSLNADLQHALTERFPSNSVTIAEVRKFCLDGIEEGWMCDRQAGGIAYGRVFPPHPELAGFSVDVVDMTDVTGPNHRHPNGEIDLILPIEDTARFDGCGEGWLVYGPDSAHPPTVTGGRAVVLYLLPDGAIEFTRS